MELNMRDELVQGLIAAVVQTADSGELHGFRLEVRDAEGKITAYVSDTAMMRSHTDPNPMSIDQAIRLIEGAGLRVYDQAQQLKVTA